MASKRDRNEPTSGFSRFDFLLTFDVRDAAARAALAACCEGEWSGVRVGDSTWEVTTVAPPDALETALAAFLHEGDRAVFYYLAESKRFFRVVVIG